MDENGAVKFPANKLEAVLTNVRALQIEENDRQSRLRKVSTAAGVRAVFAGQSYAKK
jgi:hypothetical protein